MEVGTVLGIISSTIAVLAFLGGVSAVIYKRVHKSDNLIDANPVGKEHMDTYKQEVSSSFKRIWRKFEEHDKDIKDLTEHTTALRLSEVETRTMVKTVLESTSKLEQTMVASNARIENKVDNLYQAMIELAKK